MDWNLKTYGGVLYNDFLWFSNNTFNGLFRMNILTKKVEYVDFFPEIPINNRLTHKKCIFYKDEIIFLPAFSKNIHIYNLKNNSFEIIELVDSNYRITKDIVSDAVLLDNKIYIFTWLENEPIFILDLNKKSLEKYGCVDEKILNLKIPNNHLLTRCSCYGKSSICFGILGTNIFVEWNVKNNIFTSTQLEIEDIFSVSSIESDVWIITRNNNHIYKLNNNKKLIKYEGDNIEKWNKNTRYYSSVSIFNNKIFGVPASSKKIVYWENDSFCEIGGDEWKISNLNFPAFLNTINLGSELWFLPYSTDGIFSYNESTNSVTYIPFELENSLIKGIIRREKFEERLRDGIICEDSEMSFTDYIEFLINNDSKLVL